MVTNSCEWIPAPVAEEHYGHGKRWRLRQRGREVGRVVQLLPGGLWEAHGGPCWYSPGHDTLGAAARALLLRAASLAPKIC